MTNSTDEDDALGITHTNAILSFKPIALEANGATNIIDWTMIIYLFYSSLRSPTGFCDTVTFRLDARAIQQLYTCTYLCPTLLQQTLLIISIESIPKSRFNPSSDTWKAVPQYPVIPHSPDI